MKRAKKIQGGGPPIPPILDSPAKSYLDILAISKSYIQNNSF